MSDLCKRGHELAGDNLHVTPKGSRCCRTCRRAQAVRCEDAKRARGGTTATTPATGTDGLPPGWHRRTDTRASQEAAALFAAITRSAV